MSITRQAGLAVAVVAAFLVLAPSAVRAQKMGMRPASASPPVSATAASSVAVHRVYSGSSHQARNNSTSSASSGGSARLTSGGGPSRTSPRRADADFGGSAALQNLLNITPNSGFDYEFVNSINGDLAAKALIDPVTQLEIAQAARLLRVTGGRFSGAYILGEGGYYVPSDSGEQPAPAAEDSETQQAPGPQPQPQIIILQQAPQQSGQPVSGGPEEAVTPVQDEGQFTLVLHSGKQIQTVAFTHTSDKIVYITPDGGRASIASGDLDADATVRVNEERGTLLQLPL
jgi:hypothetical protein